MGKLSPFSLGFSGCLTTAAWMLLILGGSDRRGDSREYSKSLPSWSILASPLQLKDCPNCPSFGCFLIASCWFFLLFADWCQQPGDLCEAPGYQQRWLQRERERDWLLQGWEMLQMLRARFKWQVIVDACEIVGASSAIAKRAFPHTAVGQGLRFTLL